MPLPRRTLAINFKSEDFPGPVPPTRRMVYDAFALFFNVLTIPCKRKFSSLGNTVRIDPPKVLLKLLNNQTATGVRSGVSWASGIVGRVVGTHFVAGRTATGSVITHNHDFYRKTRSLGSTSPSVDIA